MRSSVRAWPDILFIDCTYKLLNSELSVLLIAVEDSVGATEIGGVALLASEDSMTFDWCFNCFKKDNQAACLHINSIMTDKDKTMRNVLKKIFENVALYLCKFHTLQTFSREITPKKRDISPSMVERCLSQLEKLCYSRSAEEYQKLYTDFMDFAPTSVKEYYNTNWHEIKEQWTTYSMVSGNLGNDTNNRLESINGQAKAIIDKRQSLPNFIDSFFVFTASREQRVALRVAKNFTSILTTRIYTDKSDEKLYTDFLTDKAFEYVIKEIRASAFLDVEGINKKTCTFVTQHGIISKATTESCDCKFWNSMKLPCRHIMAIRSHFSLPLYCEELCNQRWTKKYCIMTQRCFRLQNKEERNDIRDLSPVISNLQSETITSNFDGKKEAIENISKDLVTVCSMCCNENFDTKVAILKELNDQWSQDVIVYVHEMEKKKEIVIPTNQSPLLTKTTKIKKMSVPQKRKIVRPLLTLMVNDVLKSNDENFCKKMNILNFIENCWRQQIDVYLSTNPETTQLSESFEKINLDEKMEKLQTSNVELKKSIKIRGRPRKFMTTWPKKNNQ